MSQKTANYRAPIRYSGYRIVNLPAEQRQIAFTQYIKSLQDIYCFIEQAMQEPFFVDDSYKHSTPEQLLTSVLMAGELFKCVYDHPVHGEVIVGIAVLKNIIPGREATLDAWTHPAFRKSILSARMIKDIFDYAFRPWNPERTDEQKKEKKGLGLMKIKAQTSVFNRSAIKALLRLGFKRVGLSPLDGLFQTVYTDIILVEKPSPIFDAIKPEALEKHGGKLTTSSAAICTTSGVHTASGLQQSGGLRSSAELHPTESNDSTSRHGEPDTSDREPARGEHGGPSTAEPATEREQSGSAERLSDGPGGDGAVRKSILSAIRESRRSSSPS